MGYVPHNISELETKIVRHYLTELEKHGWMINAANDGGDEVFPIHGVDAALEVIDSVCDSTIRFKKGEKAASIWFIAGNEEDIVSDYTIKHYEFAAICDACVEWASELEV